MHGLHINHVTVCILMKACTSIEIAFTLCHCFQHKRLLSVCFRGCVVLFMCIMHTCYFPSNGIQEIPRRFILCSSFCISFSLSLLTQSKLIKNLPVGIIPFIFSVSRNWQTPCTHCIPAIFQPLLLTFQQLQYIFNVFFLKIHNMFQVIIRAQ